MKKLLFLISIAGLMLSCNNEKKEDEAKKEQVNAAQVTSLTHVDTWPSFKLTSDMIVREPELAYRRNDGLILKIFFQGVTGSTANHGLYGYPSTDHAQHGRTRNPVIFKEVATFKTLGDNLILGNNYLNWKDVSQIIFYTSGAEMGKIRTDFGYLLLEPMDNVDQANMKHPRGCPTCNGHLWYLIRYFNNLGVEFFPGGGGGSGSSNPSPPALPGG